MVVSAMEGSPEHGATRKVLQVQSFYANNTGIQYQAHKITNPSESDYITQRSPITIIISHIRLKTSEVALWI